MKKSELFFSWLLIPVDFLMLILAGASAYQIRFAKITTDIRPIIFAENLPLINYLKIVLFVASLWLIIFALAGLYSIKNRKRGLKEIYRIILACSTGLMLVVVLIFMRRELFDSRFIVLAAWLLSIFYVSFSRLLIRWLEKYLYNFGLGVHNIVLVGNSQTTDILIKEFSKNKKLGFKIVKRLKDFSLESADQLMNFLENNLVDEIVQSDPNLSKTEVLRLYDFADEHHLVFKYAADLLGTKVLKTEVAQVAGLTIVEVKKTSLDGWGRIVKRSLDIVCSFLGIVILLPIYFLIILAIKLDSTGPIFFSKKDDGTPVYRVGQEGKPFRYFKFRSMRPSSDNLRYTDLADNNLRKDGPLVKIKDDPRVTRVGKFLRRFSLDELSELFLVLTGKMSLVGPRPHLPEEVAKYQRHHKKVLTIKPGITGLAQVSGRSDLSFEEEVKLDVYYIENWSLLLDLSIILKTPLAIFKRRQAE